MGSDMNAEDTIRAATDDTLAAYDRLIATPETEMAKWENYGTHCACRLCRVLRRLERNESTDCPLAVRNRRHLTDCMTGCIRDDMQTSYEDLRFAFRTGNANHIVAAAKVRRAALAAKFAEWD